MYQHILLAVDLTEDSAKIANKACAIAQASAARLSVVHVQEPVRYAYASEAPIDYSQLQTELDAFAQRSLQEFCQQLPVVVEQRYLLSGQTAHEIHQLSEELSCDLIVVGSHGRHGLSLIFGSHCNGVIHGAKCDVLAVRV